MAENVDIVIAAQDKASGILNRVAGNVTAMGSSVASKLHPALLLAAGGAAAAAAAFAALNVTMDAVSAAAGKIDVVAKAARGLGTTVGDLQVFQFAMGEFAGMDSAKATESLKEMQKIIGEIATGASKERATILERLGIDGAELAMQKPIDQFFTLQRAISGVGNAAERAAIADKLLAGGAKDLLPALVADTDALAASMNAAADRGLALSDAQAAGVEAMNDAIGRVKAAGEGLINQLTVELAPAIEAAALMFDSWLPPLVEAAKEHLPAIVDGMVVTAGWAIETAEALYRVATLDFTGLIAQVSEVANGGGHAVEMLREVEEARRRAQAAAEANAAAMNDVTAATVAADEAAIKAAQRAEEAAAKAAAKTIEDLERRLAVAQLGEEEVKKREELAAATNETERERISILQRQVEEQERLNKLVEDQAKEAEAKLREEERAKEQALKDEAARQKRLQADTSLGATESRLLTRGETTDYEAMTAKAAEKTAQLAEKEAQDNQKIIAELKEIVRNLHGSGQKLEVVGA